MYIILEMRYAVITKKKTGKISLGLTSMIGCIGLVITGVLGVSDGFNGFINSNVILFVAIMVIVGVMSGFLSNTGTAAVLMACVIGGSCAYVTPIGMPANTMVVGAGNYKFMHYVKSGMPLLVIATVISMIILPIAFPFYP